MHKITLLIFGLALAFVPYSYGQSCTMSDVTVIDEKGIELGACKNPDTNTGKKFTYVSKANAACCEAQTGRFNTLCINYSLCEGSKGDANNGNGNTLVSLLNNGNVALP